MDIKLIQRTAVAAAYAGGKILQEYFGKLTQINKKGKIDLVTQADLDSEKTIINAIQKKFPDHGFRAEESGSFSETSEGQWIIDPLDGTTKYAHGIAICAVSIAFSWNNEILMGVVLNPFSAELFTAISGQGALLNGQPIKVTPTASISESLLATGFPYDFITALGPIMQRFGQCLAACQGIRRLGAAALDLCYVASGRLDGFWEQNLKPWDTAAGSLIALEAGAKVTDFSNQPYHINKKEILASNGHIHEELISLLRVKEG
jgi:myo-inositol-1(or 4)-monophosphatase